MTDKELIEKLARAIGQCIEGDDEDMGRKWHGGPLWGAYVSEAEAVLPIIQADREAVRAELVREIAAWLRKGEKPFSDCDCAAHLLETGEWKL